MRQAPEHEAAGVTHCGSSSVVSCWEFPHVRVVVGQQQVEVLVPTSLYVSRATARYSISTGRRAYPNIVEVPVVHCH